MGYGRAAFGEVRNPQPASLPDDSFETAGIAGWMARRAMQVHPEIEPNLRGTVRTIVGPSFSDAELRTIQDRALNEAEMKDLEVLQGIRAGAPVYLTPAQKARIDRLMGLSGEDGLGRRARSAYDRAQRNGQIIVK
ncbi:MULTISPECIES: hypothetical protein [unclassified Phenylobacterium]|uniref:hypothetical protein n=1 Tax=unclassified Phenylobacterium TaxID=2640670 RepID=UPI0022B443A5|nr:hypothetical protein [Phenylobacterium sp. NIBR 498073]MBS0490279.1 hypothetical protein [Pseudomonadota bacterium]WGU41910.1 hypothetical protein O4N75_09295 [Phenylobacterium sp. NIBR 498073]